MTILKNQSGFLTNLIMLYALCIAMSFTAAHGAPVKHSAHKAGSKAPVKPGALPPLTPQTVVPAAVASPAVQDGDVLLYDGQSQQDAKISAAPWGGGAVEDDAQVSFSKGHSLKVTTLDPYQGAKIVFQAPIALGSMTDPSRIIVFTMRLTADTRVFPQAAPMQQSPDTGNDAPVTDNFPANNADTQTIMARYQVPADSGTDVPQAPQPGTVPTTTTAPPLQGLNELHLVFTLASGAQADVLRPYPDLSRSDAGAGVEQWVNIGVPLAALHFAGGATTSPLQSVTIAGDDYAVLYVGQIRVTQDTTPLTCFASVDEADVQRDTPVTLKSTASGGFSALKYSWDFDASDGITDQASGPVVTTQYSKGPQDYTATLTVSDIDGLKKPVTSTVVLHVQ